MPTRWSSGTPVAPPHRPRGQLVEETRAPPCESVVASESSLRARRARTQSQTEAGPSHAAPEAGRGPVESLCAGTATIYTPLWILKP